MRQIKHLVVFLLPFELCATILRVPEDFATIQVATLSALAHDTIIVSAGNYSESVLVPSMDLTYASNFILSEDTTDISECRWFGTTNGDDSLRCLRIEDSGGPFPATKISGITFRGVTHASEAGGAIQIRHQSVTIKNCVFDSCAAGQGGSLAISNAVVSIENCTFIGNGHFQTAAIAYLEGARVSFRNCLFERSQSFEEISEIPQQFYLSGSNLELRDCVLTELGFGHYPGGTTIISVGKPPDTVNIVGCSVFSNQIARLVSYGGYQVDLLRVDSTQFYDNHLRTSLYSQDAFDSLTKFQAIGNTFERFSPIPGFLMHGLFALDTATRHETKIERNLIQEIHGGHTSFCSIYGNNNELRTVRHNYILNNSNRSITWPPSGQVLTIGTGEGELEQNVFMENVGYAAFQGNLNVTSYARHNYWNHQTGPYDSVGNPGGQGDTIEWRINYQPWATDTSFMSAVPELREPVEVPQSFIGNAYPNPFNSSVTIEFVLLNDQEITLDIFDLTGRYVQTILSGRMNKGVHIRDWQPESQASGIYFARLTGAKNLSSTVKLLYMK